MTTGTSVSLDSPDCPLFLSRDKAQQLLGISHTFFYQLLAKGHLRTVKFGRKRMVPADELRRFVARVIKEAKCF